MARRLVSLAVLLVLGVLVLVACTAPPEPTPKAKPSMGGSGMAGESIMGAGMMAMTGSWDPSYRVVNGQVMSIDDAIGAPNGLSTLLSQPQPDWTVLEAR